MKTHKSEYELNNGIKILSETNSKGLIKYKVMSEEGEIIEEAETTEFSIITEEEALFRLKARDEDLSDAMVVWEQIDECTSDFHIHMAKRFEDA